MSANILYRQAQPTKGKALSCSTPSSFVASMNRAFGDFPITIGREDIPKLEGMAATDDRARTNPYEELIDAVYDMDRIEIWVVI